MARYAELEITTNFSFLRGGSHPEELVATARALDLAAIAVTDRNTLAGVVRAHLAAKEVGGIKFIVGARLDLQDAPSLLAFPRDRAAYGRLCRLLTLGQRRAEKGQCTLFLDDVASHAEGLIFIALPPDDFSSLSLMSSPGLTGRSSNHCRWLKRDVGGYWMPAYAGMTRKRSSCNFGASSRPSTRELGSISRRGTPIAVTIAPASKHSRNSHAA
jgi:DNA polymerase III alpha subunit